MQAHSRSWSWMRKWSRSRNSPNLGSLWMHLSCARGGTRNAGRCRRLTCLAIVYFNSETRSHRLILLLAMRISSTSTVYAHKEYALDLYSPTQPSLSVIPSTNSSGGNRAEICRMSNFRSLLRFTCIASYLMPQLETPMTDMFKI